MGRSNDLSGLASASSTARVALADVARAAGVSLATASRVMNGDVRVGEQLRARVLASAAELKYVANPSAQAMKRGSTEVVSVVAADLRDPYYAAITRGVMEAAQGLGLTVTLTGTQPAAHDELDLIREIKSLRPRLIVLTAASIHSEPLRSALIELLSLGRAPVAVVGPEGLPFATVTFDERAAAAKLATSLVGLGYRRPQVIAGPDAWIGAGERLQGFLDGMRAAGISIPRSQILHAEMSRDGGYRATERIMAMQPRDVDLVWAVNDRAAIGAMSCLRDHGRTPGVDVGVAGFDDVEPALDASPPLTTVHLPLVEAGAAAVELGLGRTGESVRRLSARVVLRASTGEEHSTPE